MSPTDVRPLASAAALAVALAAAGCGPTFLAVHPTEPIELDEAGLRVAVGRVLVTDDIRRRGLGDDVGLVVELEVRNEGASARRISPGSISCLMAIDARAPERTRALLPGGGAEGPFPGEPPDEGSLLAPISVPPGESRTAWAIFHGYRFDDSDVPRKITLHVPVEGGPVLVLTLADPARGSLRWETPPEMSTLAIGLRDGSTFASGLRTSLVSTEISRLARGGRFLWDVGLVSTVLVETRGPLVSDTSAFTGTGLSAHLAVPLLAWGDPHDPTELGVYAGGAAELLVEVPKPRAADDMTPLHAYGLLQAEAGLEFDLGTIRLAPTPLPLTPAGRGLPRWSLRLGYQQTWVDGVTSGGYATALRFFF